MIDISKPENLALLFGVDGIITEEIHQTLILNLKKIDNKSIYSCKSRISCMNFFFFLFCKGKKSLCKV